MRPFTDEERLAVQGLNPDERDELLSHAINLLTLASQEVQ